jgi:hypothetical protein
MRRVRLGQTNNAVNRWWGRSGRSGRWVWAKAVTKRGQIGEGDGRSR